MKLTATCVCFVFSSLFWTTQGSGQGYLSKDHSRSEACTATLQLEEPCGHGQEDADCLYSLSLPALTVHLPSQLRDLEKIMKELQELKDTVDELRKKCADCTVSPTEKMFDMDTEKEQVKLYEKADKHKDEQHCVNERCKGEEKFEDDFGTGMMKGTDAHGGEGEINTEHRTNLERGGSNKWQGVKGDNQGLIKGMDGRGVSVKDGKNQKEVVTPSGNLERSTTHTHTVAEKNNNEQRIMQDNKSEKLKGDKAKITETQKEGEKTSPDIINMDTTASYQQQMDVKKQTVENENSERIVTSEDDTLQINEEQEHQRVDDEEHTGEGIKVWQNNKILKPTENNALVVKGTAINSGESGETDGVGGTEIKTKNGNVVQSVQRASDEEESTSNKAVESSVPVSQTPPSITSFITRRHKTMDPNRVITLTSPLSSTPLWSGPHMITDVNETTVIAALGIPSHSPDFEHTQIYEGPHPEADASFRTTDDPTTTPRISSLDVPRQEITTITNRFTSIGSPRSWPGVQDQVRSTTTVAAVTEHNSRGAKNTSPSTKTVRKFGFGQGVNLGKKQGMKPEATQKVKNSKNDHKHDRTPIPDKKPVQKLKPLPQKPTVNPIIKSGNPGASEQQIPTAKIVSHLHLTGENQKNNSLLDNGPKTSIPPDQRASLPHRPSTSASSTVQTGKNTHQFLLYNEKTTAQNIRNISEPGPNKSQMQNSPQKPIPPLKSPTSNQKPATVNQTGSNQDPVTTTETENYNKTLLDGRIINQNMYRNPLPKQDKATPNRLNVQKPNFHPKSKIPISRPKNQRPTPGNTTRSDKRLIQSSKPNLKITTLQNPKNISLHKNTRVQNPNFNRRIPPPVQRPTSHNRSATVNHRHDSEKDRRKPDHNTSRFKITPNQHVKNNSSRMHDKDLKPDIQQIPPLQRPNQKSATTTTDSSEPDLTTHQATTRPGLSVKPNDPTPDPTMNHNQYPVLDRELTTVPSMLESQKENSNQVSVSYDSLFGRTSDTTTRSPTDPDRDPATKGHLVTGEITQPNDELTENILLLTREKTQGLNPQPQPEGPLQRTTFHQKTATVNTTDLVKGSEITLDSKPDHKTTDELMTTEKNTKHNAAPEQNKGQKTNSSPKSLPPAKRPATHRQSAGGSVKNPQSHQKAKPPYVSEKVKNTKQTLNPNNRTTMLNRNYNEGHSPESQQNLDTTSSGREDDSYEQEPRPVQKDLLHYNKQELISNTRTKVDVKPKDKQTPRKPAETLDQKTLPDQIPDTHSNKASTLKPAPSHRPVPQPGATSVQRLEPAVRLESSPNNKTDSNPYLSRITPDGIDLPPTSGPVSRGSKITHSAGETEFNPREKSFNLSPTSSPEKIFPLSSGLPRKSPNSEAASDLRPQTVRQPTLIPVTTRPNIMIHGILPSVITSTSPGVTELNSNTEPSATSLLLHSAEKTTPGKNSGSDKLVLPTPGPGAHTSSILSPDTVSTTSVTSAPQPPAAEYSTPSARELRVKINQVAAFPNVRQGSTGPLPDMFPKQHPADKNKGDGADYRKWMPSKGTSAIRDCSDHLLRGKTKSGVYTVTPDLRSKSFPVFCDMKLTGGGWTLLQRRYDGSVSFNRTWADYRSGFGQLNGGEFWLGNNLIHLLTRDRDMVLRVELEDFEGVKEYAEYDRFKVASERLRYKLSIGGYSGTAGDALQFNKIYNHNNKPFTTPDRDNDGYPSGNCGAYYSSGWWFSSCMSANLNGRYYKEGKYKGLRDGIFWGTWHNITSEYYPTNDRHSFKTVRMMIRPKGFEP